MNGNTQRSLKAQGLISCTHGVRHIRRTNLPQSDWIARKDGSYSDVYCRKCEPAMGRAYRNLRWTREDAKARDTKAAKDTQQV